MPKWRDPSDEDYRLPSAPQRRNLSQPGVAEVPKQTFSASRLLKSPAFSRMTLAVALVALAVQSVSLVNKDSEIAKLQASLSNVPTRSNKQATTLNSVTTLPFSFSPEATTRKLVEIQLVLDRHSMLLDSLIRLQLPPATTKPDSQPNEPQKQPSGAAVKRDSSK
jgi:hypothetical protein